jgi:hypothetical protein
MPAASYFPARETAIVAFNAAGEGTPNNVGGRIANRIALRNNDVRGGAQLRRAGYGGDLIARAPPAVTFSNAHE